MISERTRQAYERWSHAQLLVVSAAQQIVADFDNAAARVELVGAVKAERRARHVFERAMKAESAGDGDGH